MFRERILPTLDPKCMEPNAKKWREFGKEESVANQFHIPLHEHFVEQENKNFVLFGEHMYSLTLDQNYPHCEVLSIPCPKSSSQPSIKSIKPISAVKKVATSTKQKTPTATTPSSAETDKIEKQRKRAAIQKWTTEEDKLLLDAVRKYGTKSWVTVADLVKTKTKEQCHQHYHRVLDPTLNKKPWTEEEDAKLLELVQKFGSSAWKHVSGAFDGARSDTKCRERYFSLVKKQTG